MRLELAGTLILPEPVILRYTANASFVPQIYLDLGFTHFEVICIGGGGGAGGGIDTANTGTLIRNYGGAGGGGGLHRARGLLSALPATVAVVVGAGGAPGLNHASLPTSTTNGSDGGASTFNNLTCRASGGKGGLRAQSNSATVSTGAKGGDGGVGNRSIAGGGGLGGSSGTPSTGVPTILNTDGADGTYFNNIGKGGGGGAGGVGKYGLGNTSYYLIGTNGGRGCYNPADLSVYGPAGMFSNDPQGCGFGLVPGGASGAKAAPLNGLPTVYGQSKSYLGAGDPGYTVVRLTAE